VHSWLPSLDGAELDHQGYGLLLEKESTAQRSTAGDKTARQFG